jgi:SNF2 family DNA or RNA helicase
MEIKKLEQNYATNSKRNRIISMSSSPRIPPNHVRGADRRYKLATGAKEDRAWLKKFNFDVCIFDEGHMLKNSMSKQYLELMKLTANFRVLLTGTVPPPPPKLTNVP